jgi:hypothetical protein
MQLLGSAPSLTPQRRVISPHRSGRIIPDDRGPEIRATYPHRAGSERYSPNVVVKVFSEVHIRDAAYILLKRQRLPF